MRDLCKIIVYLLVSVLVGALLAPPMYWGGQWLASRGVMEELLADSPFQRYFNRAVLVAAVALLWPLWRWLDLRWVGRFTMQRDRRGWSNFLYGLGVGVLVIAMVGCALLWADLYRVKREIPWDELLKVPLTAFGVAAVEELFFRGLLLGLVMRELKAWAAVVVVSLLYAAVHFLKAPDVEMAGPVEWWSAFPLIPGAFWWWSAPAELLPAFATLFALGLILGGAAVGTRALWLSFGVHAGVVLAKFGFTKVAKRRGELPPWFGEHLEAGLGALAAMGVLALLVWLRVRRLRRA